MQEMAQGSRLTSRSISLVFVQKHASEELKRSRNSEYESRSSAFRAEELRERGKGI